ncbi:MAG: hypothetical protein K2Q22_16310 [Cytophagales bacterium]|nr:hypothetical protein [Cytophagales bacterium]
MKVGDEEFNVSFEYLTNNSYHFRGKIISGFNTIDSMLGEYIATYFVGDESQKHKELSEYVFGDRMDYETKRLIFVYIIQKYHPSLLIKYKKEINDLEYLMKERNHLAHAILDTSLEGVEEHSRTGNFAFYRFKNNTKRIVYDKAKGQKLHKCIDDIQNMLIELQKK